MKTLSLFAIGALSLLPLGSQALPLNDDVAVELELTLASDYRTRGISQTQNDPAAQAAATLLHSSGLYLGAWTSNVDFGGGLKTRQEVDYYAGWLWQASDAVSLDLGYLKYSYPREGQFNQSEVYGIFNAYGITLAAYYSNDAPGIDSQQSTLYRYLGYETELPLGLGLALRYGEMDFKDPRLISASGQGEDAYHEWEARLTREVAGVVLGLSYIDTDLSKSQCTGNYGFSDLCGATWVASARKTF
ncbi:TorF family putative porin [Pseudomonas chlororaphis]|uniref:TorF family putative porin n=1 Tax=Pseudomonas chlororaphis TaxID=587753 RepID=UPI002365B9B3|nr:TorF family putative porin [Pseudomonas chlororaphis]WDG52676.1 TorF family putative porin [Pseudomonas chlororaphis]WDH86304.1 TorF family putative porin [Pseudomonas chlororaphis]